MLGVDTGSGSMLGLWPRVQISQICGYDPAASSFWFKVEFRGARNELIEQWLVQRRLQDAAHVFAKLGQRDKGLIEGMSCPHYFFSPNPNLPMSTKRVISKLIALLADLLVNVDWTVEPNFRQFLRIGKTSLYKKALRGVNQFKRVYRRSRGSSRGEVRNLQQARALAVWSKAVLEHLPTLWTVAQAAAQIHCPTFTSVIAIHSVMATLPESSGFLPAEQRLLLRLLRGRKCVIIARGSLGTLSLVADAKGTNHPNFVFRHQRLLPECSGRVLSSSIHRLGLQLGSVSAAGRNTETITHHHQYRIDRPLAFSERSPEKSREILERAIGQVAKSILSKMLVAFIYLEIFKTMSIAEDR